MKTSRKIITGFLFSVIFTGAAQTKDSIQFGGMQQLNLTFGNSGASIGLNIVNGVRFHRFFVGLGADYRFTRSYNFGIGSRTSAIYLDGRYYMNKRKNLFVKADGGVNLIVGDENSEYGPTFVKKPGYYGGVGFGFKTRLTKELFYSFDVSYAIKQTVYSYSYTDWRFPNEMMTEKYDRRQPMIVINMGFELF